MFIILFILILFSCQISPFCLIQSNIVSLLYQFPRNWLMVSRTTLLTSFSFDSPSASSVHLCQIFDSMLTACYFSPSEHSRGDYVVGLYHPP